MRTSRSTALVLLGAWTLLVLVVLLNSAGSLAIDIKPELYLAPWRMVTFFANPWQESPQLGWPSFNVGLASAATAEIESDTQPKIAPCAFTIARPISWNSGK